MINPELKRFGKEEGSAYISFMTGDDDLDTNYLEEADTIEEVKEDGEASSTD